MAQSWFESNYGKSFTVPTSPNSLDFGFHAEGFTTNSQSDTVDAAYLKQSITITPRWNQSQIAAYLRVNPILFVPVERIPSLDEKGMHYTLVFFRDSSNQINSRLQLFAASEDYIMNNRSLDMRNFKGLFAQVGMDGIVQKIYVVENGQYTHRVFSGRPQLQETDPSECPTFGGWFKAMLEDFTSAIRNFCKGGSDNGGPVIIIGPEMPGYPPVGFAYGSGSGGNGGGTPSTTPGLWNELDNTIFRTTDINPRLRLLLTQLNASATPRAFLEDLHNQDENITDELLGYLRNTGLGTVEQERVQKVRTHVEISMEHQSYLTYWRSVMGSGGIPVIFHMSRYLANGFTKQEVAELFSNFEVFAEVDNVALFDGMDENFADAVRFYQKMLKENPNFSAFNSQLNGLSGGNSNPLVGLAVDLLVEGATELVGHALGLSELEELKSLLSNINFNGAKKVAFRACRVVIKFLIKKNVIVNSATTIWKAKEVYDKIMPAFNSFKMLGDLNTQLMTKLTEAFKNTGGGLMKRFINSHDGSSTLAGHFDIDVTSTTTNNFLNRFANAFGLNWINQSGGAKTLDLSSFGVEFCRFYLESTTQPPKPTMHIKLISGQQMKFRFNE
jgi:hypothetical protein